MTEKIQKPRYGFLDTLRGLVLISMIAYHGSWDLVYLYGMPWEWYHSIGAYIWQQSICWTFIFLSGFCWSMGRRPLKRGLLIFGGGIIVTAVTLAFMWEDRVIFGILTLLGSCMLLMIPLHKIVKKWNPWTSLAGSILLFLLLRNINSGYIGFEGWNLLQLPEGFYHGYVATFLGFCDASFYSTDYFSLFPWFFLFLAGYFLYQGLKEKGIWDRDKDKDGKGLLDFSIPPLAFLGRHSFPIYMLHQPVLYLVFQVLFAG